VRLAFIADVHVGNMNRFGRGTMRAGLNRRARLTLDALREASNVAKAYTPSRLIVVGDLLDSVSVPPQIIAGTQNAMAEAPPTVYLVGNHEQASTDPGDHSVGAVASRTGWAVERPTLTQLPGAGTNSLEVISVPFDGSKDGRSLLESGIASIELTRDDVGEEEPERVLVTHLGVEDSSTPVWLRGAHDSIKARDLHEIMVRAGIRLAVVGNWHNHRVWSFDDGRKIVQCGALVPTGFANPSTMRELRGDDEDPYGSLILWDSKRPGSITRHVVHGPRFVKTRQVDEAVEALEFSPLTFVELTTSPDAMEQARAALAERCTSWEDCEDRIEIVADTKDVQRRIETAAASARDSSSADRAISEYVSAMPLDEDLDRADVLASVRGYVAAGGTVS